jgi:predicted phage-related endonuclease
MALTPEAIALRRKFVTGSDAGAIMKGEWLDLWKLKTGRAEERDLSDVFEVQLGILTETLNLDWLEKFTGRQVTSRGQWCQCLEYDWMGCTIDGMTTTIITQEPVVVDAKHVGRSDEAMVRRYTPQMVHNATVLGVEWWILSVIAGNKWQPPIIQKVDPFYQAELITREREFWQYVLDDKEPPEQVNPTAAPKPQPRLRIVQLEDEFRDTWPNWGGEAIKEIRTFAETDSAAKAHAIARENLKTIVPDDVGEVTRGLFRLSRSKDGKLTMVLKKGDDDAS